MNLENDFFEIAGKKFHSRLLVGTGKYKDFQETALAIDASGAEIVTVALRRVNIEKKGEAMLQDFLSPEILRQGKFIHEIFNKLKSYYKRGIPVSIVTARSSSDLVRNFFLDQGIDIHPQLVIAINDPQYGYKGSVAKRKQEAIRDLIDLGFKHLTFFDDSEDNLRLAKEIEGYKGATIKLIKVD